MLISILICSSVVKRTLVGSFFTILSDLCNGFTSFTEYLKGLDLDGFNEEMAVDGDSH